MMMMMTTMMMMMTRVREVIRREVITNRSD